MLDSQKTTILLYYIHKNKIVCTADDGIAEQLHVSVLYTGHHQVVI
jgi:hypothetical protein